MSTLLAIHKDHKYSRFSLLKFNGIFSLVLHFRAVSISLPGFANMIFPNATGCIEGYRIAKPFLKRLWPVTGRMYVVGNAVYLHRARVEMDHYWASGLPLAPPPPWHPRSCRFMLLRTLKAFPHPGCGHLKGFSPVCE